MNVKELPFRELSVPGTTGNSRQPRYDTLALSNVTAAGPFRDHATRQYGFRCKSTEYFHSSMVPQLPIDTASQITLIIGTFCHGTLMMGLRLSFNSWNCDGTEAML
jgi:hypothetical protein